MTRSWNNLRVIAIGSRVFVTSFKLSGVEGIKVDSASQILSEINKLGTAGNVGLILLSDDMAKEIRYQLTELRTRRPIPLIFELPAPGSTKENVDYRGLLKQILGV
jgi:V/A-type H+-transporting ATPase subunit F